MFDQRVGDAPVIAWKELDLSPRLEWSLGAAAAFELLLLLLLLRI